MTYLNVGYAERCDGGNLVLAGSWWLELIQRSEQTVKVIYGWRSHDDDAYSTPGLFVCADVASSLYD